MFTVNGKKEASIAKGVRVNLVRVLITFIQRMSMPLEGFRKKTS